MIREYLEAIIGLTCLVGSTWGAWLILHGMGF